MATAWVQAGSELLYELQVLEAAHMVNDLQLEWNRNHMAPESVARADWVGKDTIQTKTWAKVINTSLAFEK